MKIELDILWLDENQIKLRDMGLEPTGAGTTKKMTFLHINYIQESVDEGEPVCLIGTNGSEFIAKQTFAEVQAMIEGKLITT